LYVVINEKNIYELAEQQPVIIEEALPINISAKNGYHLSNTITISNENCKAILIGVSCVVDNGKFWGCTLLSVWLFIMFFATTNYFLLALANLPVLYIKYFLFWQAKHFLKVKIVSKK
jgi:hypothetical protein